MNANGSLYNSEMSNIYNNSMVRFYNHVFHELAGEYIILLSNNY